MTEAAVQDVAPPNRDASIAARNRVAIVVLLLSTFVVFLNETTMGVALPKIMTHFTISASAGQWLTTVFALTAAIVVPITGWLLQRLNTRPVFITAMSLFTAGTLLGAVAPTFGLLLFARVVQASGTSIMMPLLMTTVLQLVPLSNRGRIMGRTSIVISVAPAIGPAVSGLIVQALDWEFVFWLVLPIAAAMLIVGIVRIPNVTEPRRAPLDYLSIVLSAFAFGGLVYGLSALGSNAEGDGLVAPWIPLAVGAVFLVLFVLRQLVLQRRDAALLDLRTFRSRTFTMSIVMFIVMMLSLFGTVIVLPLYAQRVLGADTLTSGLVLLPGGLIMGLIGPLVGRVFDKRGTGPLIVPGAVLVSLGFWGLAMAGAGTSVWFLLIPHIVMSVGLGMLFTTLFTVSTSALPPHLYSHGSATLTTLQQVAGAAGTALFVALLAAGTVAAGSTNPAHPAPRELMQGVHWAFLFGAFASLVPIVIGFFVRKPKAPELTDEELETRSIPVH
jgi:DHA2 family lincomycin resistance protein-like MFS transporter